jgi:hypothetical protein
MYGQAPAEKGEYPEKLTINYEQDKPRTRRFQRFEPGPAAVHKVSNPSFLAPLFISILKH